MSKGSLPVSSTFPAFKTFVLYGTSFYPLTKYFLHLNFSSFELSVLLPAKFLIILFHTTLWKGFNSQLLISLYILLLSWHKIFYVLEFNNMKIFPQCCFTQLVTIKWNLFTYKTWDCLYTFKISYVFHSPFFKVF